MASRVTFTRPKRVPGVEPRAASNESPAVGGRGVVPPKGGTTTPLTPSRPAPEKNKKEARTRVDEILDMAVQLDSAELKELLARISLLGQQDLEKKSVRDIDMWATAVHEALTAAFGHGDGAGLGSAVVKRVVGAATAWRPVNEFMESSGLVKLDVPVRLGMYRMLATMAVRRSRAIAAKTGVPVTPKFVASVAANLGAIFDLEFPGYLAAGLAPMVAKRLTSI